jgi:signal transduction histidine kinase/ActR/RegA family two-component response regulator
MPDCSTLDLVVGLSKRSTREAAAEALASRLGVQTVLLFVSDPALSALIPAPGLPQTLYGGRTWRTFLAGCPAEGRYKGEVELPKGTQRSALAVIADGTAVVLLGGTPVETAVAEVERVLPMLAALLAAEQVAVIANSEAEAAREASRNAHALAAALEAARAEAAALNAELRDEHRRKDEFLAMLGHELRNPLSPLVTSIALLRLRAEGEGVPPGLVDVMARQTAQLSRLVDDLLDVSRVSRGRIELKRERLLLSDVLQDALEESRQVLHSQRHEVTVSGTEEPLTVNGDRARLVQVFGNLLNNAAKYTDPGGRITLALLRDKQNAIVHVRDNGIGIAADMRPRIFDLFAQAPVALGRAEGGLGIGLTLVRTLVELHAGRVKVDSAGVGQGSTFTVSLPLAPLQPVENPSIVPLKSETPETALHVLIVDDNRDAADSMAVLLRLMGHRADVAYDGSTALQLPSKSNADLILLDIGLPGMDGYEVARQLRPSAKRGARLVALTGYGTEEGKLRARDAGFDEHVVKPVSSEKLEQLISASAKAPSRAI